MRAHLSSQFLEYCQHTCPEAMLLAIMQPTDDFNEAWDAVQNQGLCFEQGLSSSGSGLILDPDGTILTSAQIVSAAAETRRGVNGRMQQPKVLITLQDRRVYQGRVISSDRYSIIHLLDFYLCRSTTLPCTRSASLFPL